MNFDPACQDLLSFWLLGLNGACMNPKAGFRIGKTGYKLAGIQVKCLLFKTRIFLPLKKTEVFINCMDFILLIKHKKTCLIRIKNLNKCDGKLSYTKNDHLFLQVHWENQQLNPDEYDSSGLNIFYTKHLRVHDTGILFLGQSQMTIPPGRPRYVETGVCHSECTEKMLSEEINVTYALNQMHYLGKVSSLNAVNIFLAFDQRVC